VIFEPLSNFTLFKQQMLADPVARWTRAFGSHLADRVHRLVKVCGQILDGHQRLENLARRRRTSRLSAPAHDPAPAARIASGHGRSQMSGSGADLPCRRSLEPLANAERISP